VIHLNGFDAGSSRALADLALEPLDRLYVALRRDLDAAVGKIPDPPMQPLMFRGIGGEIPEADALHAAADDIPSRDTHRERAIIACVIFDRTGRTRG
jgi:hypothetical protein